MAGEAHFSLHFSLMQVMIEVNLPLGRVEHEVVLFCDWIGEYCMVVLGMRNGFKTESCKGKNDAVMVSHTEIIYL